MAERRMFAKTIIDSDAFLDMPISAQALYFHLSMRADDDGFINNPKKIQRMVGASNDDYKLLIIKRFIIAFDSGVIAIKHWKIHNYIRNDRYKPTVYQGEKSKLIEKENKAYTERLTVGIPIVNQMDTQVRIDKSRIEKSRINNKDSLIEEFSVEVQEAIKSFMVMREKQKKPMTENALRRIIAKLKKLSSNPEEQVKILNQSEDACWLDIYPIKQDKKKSSDNNNNIFLTIAQEEGCM